MMPNNTVRVSGLANGTIKASGDLLDEDGYFRPQVTTGTATSLS